MCSSSNSSSTSSSASSSSSVPAEKSALIRTAAVPLCDPSTSSGSSSPSSELASYPLIPRDQLQVQQHLGAGTFGSVFKGLWERPDGSALPVALKKVFILEKEVEILSQIRHRNIIQFYGISQANPDFFIVTEFAENGSLYEHLHNKDEQISLERTIKWAIQIARGVAYLHYEAPITVIHRDLKSKNIVIGKKFQCKICDFGTSKDLTHSWTAPSWGGTAAWMSPEIISQREGITTATDVWSFAVVLWEMFSRQVPYKGLTEFKIYSIISQHGVRLVIPPNCPEPLAKLLENCWSLSPKERPDMKTVLAILERMAQDKDLHEECAQFLCGQGQQEWRQRIQEQLEDLDALKLDLARQMEDLFRREQALRKRESSHRNFLHMVDILNVEDVCEWNEDCVCEWVQNIAAAAVADFPEESVDKIISCILQYSINGPRLLKITEKDLDSLGIEAVALRRYIMHKLDELRELCNVQLCNFPCSPNSGATDIPANCNSTNNSGSIETPIDCPIMLHVGLYSRSMAAGKLHRFKVFLDSDWEEMASAENGEGPKKKAPPEELCDSSTVIKEVNISMSAGDGSSLVGPVQCICPPFGYLEWAQISREEQQSKLPLTISLQVVYTDQVIQPRNTRIQIKLDDLAGGPRTLCCKRVPLKLCPTATDTSLSRISSTLQRNPLKSPPATATFRSRRRSFGLNGSISPDRKPNGIGGSSTNLLNRSPIWADLAANIRNSTFPTFRPVSRSITNASVSAAACGVHRSTSSEEDAAIKRGSVDIQTARQRALAKVRAQRAQRKKCFSETESDRQNGKEDETEENAPATTSPTTPPTTTNKKRVFILDSPTPNPSSSLSPQSGTSSHSRHHSSSSSSSSPSASSNGSDSKKGSGQFEEQKEQQLIEEEEPLATRQRAKCVGRTMALMGSREDRKMRPPHGLSRLLVPTPENLMKITGNSVPKFEKVGRT